jgi:nickel-dependent lactate racemase
VPVYRRFKTVLTSAAGYPLDKTYYQTVKGMVAPLDILERGGNLIVASECSEGMGSPEFVDAQRRLKALGPDRFLRDIAAKRFADVDEWQTQMQLKPMRAGTIQLYSTGPIDRELTGVAAADSVEEAVQHSATQMRDPHVAVIPEGPYVVPFFQPKDS